MITIQPKKHDNRKSSGSGGCSWQGSGDEAGFEKGSARQYMRGFHKIRGLGVTM